MEISKKGYKEYLRATQIEKLCNDLESDKKHQTLIKLCAKAFAQTELSESSGYEFYFAEPLLEQGPEKKGNHSFDLFLYNEKENRAIFIECKSSISDSKKILKEVEDSRDLILKKIDYLSDIVGTTLDPGRIEYVLCIFDRDSTKITMSHQSQSKKNKPKYDTNLIKLWIYKPRTQIVQLYLHHSHNNQALTDLLLKGFGEEKLKRQFEIPYCITTHPFRIIKLAIISDCYLKNLYNDECDDPKIIEISEIFDTLMRNISLGVSLDLKKSMVKEKLTRVLRYGIKYQLFKKIQGNQIRLTCRGTKIKIVIENIQNKFIENWIDEKTEKKAEKLVLEEFRKKGMLDQKTLFEKYNTRVNKSDR